MSTHHISRLAAEIFHLECVDNVASNEFLAWWDIIIVVKYLKFIAHRIHLLLNSDIPKPDAACPIYLSRVCRVQWNLNAKLVRSLDRACLHHIDDTVLFLQHVSHPPTKGGLMINPP